MSASAANAQVAANVTLASNDVYRGRSLSADDPALTVAVGLDDQSGFYAGGSVTLAAGEMDFRASSSAQYAGYAWRTGRTSFEVGAIHRHHSDSLDQEYSKDYFEGYFGVSHGKTSMRLYLSPDYIPGDRVSAYVSLDTELARIDDWSLAGHAGLALKPTRDEASRSYHAEVDWSLSAGRAFGEYNMSVGISDSSDSDPKPFDGPLLFVKASRAF
ncbi:MAG: TorF family putative porin [Novosphingobium sp.]|nr:TorF family putative porin [Novosphingobium sp.]